MGRAQATDVLSAKSTPGTDPTGREIMARQFAAAPIDPTGREVMIRQRSAQKDASAATQAA
jgi:hypothetical protein